MLEFQKGQIIHLHHAKQTIKYIVKTTNIGLRTVQCIIKTWKDSGKPSSLRKKCA